MKQTLSLYRLAERRGILVDCFPAPETGSLCICSAGGQYYIGLDTSVVETEDDQRVHLAHELGHCCTGSLYSHFACCDVRQKHENRADKWAIKKLVPKDELDEAVSEGYTDLWSLAEQFGVTEEFMRKVVCWYTHGNLASELYF